MSIIKTNYVSWGQQSGPHTCQITICYNLAMRICLNDWIYIYIYNHNMVKPKQTNFIFACTVGRMMSPSTSNLRARLGSIQPLRPSLSLSLLNYYISKLVIHLKTAFYPSGKESQVLLWTPNTSLHFSFSELLYPMYADFLLDPSHVPKRSKKVDHPLTISHEL